jgi:hypothetical protein
MAETTITIQLDAETARIYSAASEEDRRKMALLLSLWLREYAAPRRSLREIMDSIGGKAQERGLTPEILDELLSDD